MTLGEYIAQASSRRFEWAAHDCSTFAADWRVLRGHFDPMADIRGRYHDEASGLGLIYEGGGLLKLWSDRMPEPSENPIAGAVAVLNIGDEIMGIYSGERWIVLMDSGIRGIIVPKNRVLRAWDG